MYTLAAMRAILTNRINLSTSSSTQVLWQDQSIGQMIDSAWWRIQDVAYADLALDGVTARWFLPGEDITILPPAMQIQPALINTARLASPAAAPTVTASGSGSSLPVGVYRCAIAYNTAYGQTGLSPETDVTVTAGQNIVFAAMTFPATGEGIPAVVTAQCYITDANSYTWKNAGLSVGTPVAITSPAATPAAGKPFLVYASSFSAVSWLADAPDSVLIEDGVKADGTLVDPAVDIAGATISATVAPTVTGNLSMVRVRYQRRVPQPDYTAPLSLLRVPEQWARIATLGYYLGIVADNQSGGDMRSLRAESEARLQQADLLYRQSVPLVLPARFRVEQWLAG